jgi:hypothetical protein
MIARGIRADRPPPGERPFAAALDGRALPIRFT